MPDHSEAMVRIAADGILVVHAAWVLFLLAGFLVVRGHFWTVRELGLDAVVVRGWRLANTARYDYPRPPALALDGQLICSGRTMGVREIKRWLRRGRDAECTA